MRILSLHINKFRLFENVTFDLGKYMTVLSGTNSVGKSTLLGILGNSSELKVKSGRPILQKQFRTEFSEIFRMSPKHDKSASNICTITFDNSTNRFCRITWQKDRKTHLPRPRMIPEFKDASNKKRSSKQNWPTLFLGLSRLFPLGESSSISLAHSKYSVIPDQYKTSMINNYKRILSINDPIQDMQSVTLPDVKKKTAFGIVTESYDYLSNSAGQDNLGQILLAVESFRLLKDRAQETYNGGLLLIDEIDATLHPSAQVKLVQYLLKEAKALSLQIVFTTHSLSILNYVAKSLLASSVNPDITENDTNLYYLSTANGALQVITNPSYYTVQSLLEEDPLISQHTKIKVYTEDSEARWFIKNLPGENWEQLRSRIDLLNTEIGNESILSIVKGDPIYFFNKIIILDGDSIQKKKIKDDIDSLNKANQHIFVLPGDQSPEKSILYFLQSDTESANNFFNQQICLNQGITKSYYLHSNDQSAKDDRVALKNWLKKFEQIFQDTHLMEFYTQTHKQEIDNLYVSLKTAYNKIAKSQGLSLIK